MSKPSERAVKAYDNFVSAYLQHSLHTESSTDRDLLSDMRADGKEAQRTFDAWLKETSLELMSLAIPPLTDTRMLRPDNRVAMNSELVRQLKSVVGIHRKWTELVAVAGNVKKIPKLARRIEKAHRNQAA